MFVPPRVRTFSVARMVFSLRRHWVLVALLGALLGAGAAGCSRARWRERADRQSYAAIQGKLCDPQWAVPRVDVNPDPLSRMYDPHDPDCPPLPPADPAARSLMHCPGGMRGSKEWFKFGETCFNENPYWMTPFPPVGDTSLEERIEAQIPKDNRLTLEQLLELSYLHNRNYQTQIETLYLAALDLTFDRFLFTVRHRGLSGLEPGGDLEYENVPQDSDNLRLRSRWGLRKLLPTGTQFIAEIANDTLWLFSGPNNTNSVTIASYSIVKPLLFGAGRTFVLENLTQSERNVLYAARDLARFRREFFVNTVSGGQSGGLLGLLLQRQQILNTEANIEELSFQVKVLTELQSRPPREFVTELRATAAPLLQAAMPAALNGKLVAVPDRAENEVGVLLAWTLPMNEAEANALEEFIEATFAEDRSTARFVLGRVRDELILPAREEQFVEFEDPLPDSLDIEPGDPLPGFFDYRVGLERRTGKFADFARYEKLETGDGFRVVWNGPMLLEQEDALLALSDDPAFTAIVERIAVLTRARQSLDIAQLQTRLLNTENALREAQRRYRDSLDRYKIELGLPPDVLLPIDECLLQEFELIDPRLSDPSRRNEYDPAQDEFGPSPNAPGAGMGAGEPPFPGGLPLPMADGEATPIDPETGGPAEPGRSLFDLGPTTTTGGLEQRLLDFVDEVYAIDPEAPDIDIVREILARLVSLQEDIGETGLGLVRRDLDALRSELADIRARLPGPLERERLQRDFERDVRRFGVIENTYNELAALLAQLTRELAGQVGADRLIEIANEMRTVREELLKLVRELKVVQIGARVERISVQPVDIELDQAIAIALENRVDLMNQRAFVTDARRQLEVTANRLKAVLDVRAEGDTRVGEGGPRSSYRVGVAFSTPLDRQGERNDYRAAQIAFQRAKRDYTLFEDNVKFQIRTSWRQLRVLRENFEVSRQALRFSAAQLDQAAESALEPQRAGASRGAGSQGLNLLNALNSVLSAQNSLIGNWVDYESARLNLYRDMGMMQVDECGMWDDPFYRSLSERCRGGGSQQPISEESVTPPAPTVPEPAGEESGPLPDGPVIPTNHEATPVGSVLPEGAARSAPWPASPPANPAPLAPVSLPRPSSSSPVFRRSDSEFGASGTATALP